LTIRLPTLGGAPDPAFEDPPAGMADAPGTASRPLLCVAGASATVPILPVACALVRALSEGEHAPAALRVRRRRGSPEVVLGGADVPDATALAEAGALPVVVARTDAVHAAAVVAEALQVLGEGEGAVVCVGNDVPALYPAALTVLVTGGLAPSRWAASARALAGAVDLELTDLRPGFAPALVQAWWRRSGSGLNSET
jgi:hypothetical protein